ncbi:hypothetical protein D3C83_22900 [compost metagenome]
MFERTREGEDVANVVIDDQHLSAGQAVSERLLPGEWPRVLLLRPVSGSFLQELPCLVEHGIAAAHVLHQNDFRQPLHPIGTRAGACRRAIYHDRDAGRSFVLGEFLEQLP